MYIIRFIKVYIEHFIHALIADSYLRATSLYKCFSLLRVTLFKINKDFTGFTSLHFTLRTRSLKILAKFFKFRPSGKVSIAYK